MRRSNPGFFGSMIARYISSEHPGHSGLSLIGVFCSVYSENVICDSPSLQAGAANLTFSHRYLTEITWVTHLIRSVSVDCAELHTFH